MRGVGNIYQEGVDIAGADLSSQKVAMQDVVRK